MSTEIASLYAKIGADTSEFEKGAAKVKQGLGSLAPGLENAARGVTNFISSNAALIGGLGAVAIATKASYDEFIRYAGEVRDLAAVSGTGAEESSKLLQVLDDYQLTAQDVTAATRFMTKQGLTPTIETLAKLADEYNAINDPMRQNEFILKNLGRGGLQWVNVLKQGGTALREQATEVNKSLILTDEQVKKSEQARLAMDALSDVWEGGKVQLGSLVGGLIVAVDAGDKMIDVERKLAEAAGKTNLPVYALSDAYGEQASNILNLTNVTDAYDRALNRNTSTVYDNADAQSTLASSNENMLGLIDQLQSETDSYNQKNYDLVQQLIALNDQQANTPTWSSDYQTLTGKIQDTKTAITKLAEEHDKASKKIAFDLVMQKAASDGWADGEFENLLTLGEQWGVYDEKVVDSAINMDRQAGKMAEALAKPKSQLTDVVDKVNNLEKDSGKSFDFYVNIHVKGGIPSYIEYGEQHNVVGVSKRAMGGKLTGWTLVGDMPGGIAGPYSELISPNGYVFDARTTRKLMSSGAMGRINARSVTTDDTGGSPPPVVITPGSSGGGSKGGKTGGGGTGGGGTGGSSTGGSGGGGGIVLSVPPVAATVSGAAQMQVILQQQQRALQKTISDNQARMADQLAALIAVMKSDNPRAIGKSVAYEVRKNS